MNRLSSLSVIIISILLIHTSTYNMFRALKTGLRASSPIFSKVTRSSRVLNKYYSTRLVSEAYNKILRDQLYTAKINLNSNTVDQFLSKFITIFPLAAKDYGRKAYLDADINNIINKFSTYIKNDAQVKSLKLLTNNLEFFTHCQDGEMIRKTLKAIYPNVWIETNRQEIAKMLKISKKHSPQKYLAIEEAVRKARTPTPLNSFFKS